MAAPIFWVLAALFAFMGAVAMVAPERVTRQFGIDALNRDGRNEVRAVYGGFGLAMAAGFVAAQALPELRNGFCLAAALALGGMAGGRVVSAAIDRGIGRFPVLYGVLESIGAAASLYARTL
jgi:hypothetical protein